ncbi:hypothetical protein Hanom_Chr05g00405891 [Helianthus anomalus]
MGYPNGLVSQGKQPLFSFGVITDVQYADITNVDRFLSFLDITETAKGKLQLELICKLEGSMIVRGVKTKENVLMEQLNCKLEGSMIEQGVKIRLLQRGVSSLLASIDETPEGQGFTLSRAFRDFFV